MQLPVLHWPGSPPLLTLILWPYVHTGQRMSVPNPWEWAPLLSSLCGGPPSCASAEQTEQQQTFSWKGSCFFQQNKSIQITLGSMALSSSSKSVVWSERRKNNAVLYFKGGITRRCNESICISVELGDSFLEVKFLTSFTFKSHKNKMCFCCSLVMLQEPPWSSETKLLSSVCLHHQRPEDVIY